MLETKSKIKTPDKTILQRELRELELKCDRARWWVLSYSPFYGQLMMGLQDRIMYIVPTAATNGEVIIWNPDFLKKLTDQEVRFVLIHETLHCAYGHIWRFPPLIDDKGNKKMDGKGNIACDHAINLNILALATDTDVSMPKGGLADAKFKGLAEEEIYKLLPDSQDDGYVDKYDPTGAFISLEDGEGEDNQEGNEKGKDGSNKISLKDKWERRLIQVAQVAKSSRQGNLPADLQRILDDRMVVKIDFRQECADFLKNCISTRNDYTRAPHRHAWMSVIMPRRRQNNVDTVLAYRDTSGSVNDEIISVFNCLLENLIAELGCKLIILDCDAIIQEIYHIDIGQKIPRNAKGGGGTDFRPVFEKTKELQDEGENIAGIVCLTDMYGTFPQTKNYPELPTLWLSTSKDKIAPFGRTVYVEV